MLYCFDTNEDKKMTKDKAPFPKQEKKQDSEGQSAFKQPPKNQSEKPEKKAEDIQAYIEKCQADIDHWKDLALRSQAEMENLRKRTQTDIEKANKYANAGFAKDLLQVADFLNGAIQCAQKELDKLKAENKNPDPFLKNLLTGVEMTEKQLQTVFNNHQIKRMETIGRLFDPNFDKVIQEVEDPSKEPGTIVQELQAGYTIGSDRVLREAMVIVSKK